MSELNELELEIKDGMDAVFKVGCFLGFAGGVCVSCAAFWLILPVS